MQIYTNLKIDRKEVHGGPAVAPFRGQRAKVNVTRPLNTVTENQPYLQNGKDYEPQTWYTGGVRQSATPTCAIAFLVTSHMPLTPASVDLNSHPEL